VPTDLPDTELDAIEARAKAATPGPWRQGAVDKIRVFGDPDGETLAPGLGRCVCIVNQWTGEERRDADAAFIAAAREDVPRLVAALREARKQLAEVVDYAARQDAELATLRAEPARRTADAALDAAASWEQRLRNAMKNIASVTEDRDRLARENEALRDLWRDVTKTDRRTGVCLSCGEAPCWGRCPAKAMNAALGVAEDDE
jgi:hypothetical protein